MWVVTSEPENEDDAVFFGELYDKLAEDLYHRVYRLLGNQQDTEDTLQNVWFSVAIHIQFFRMKTDEAIRPYLFRMAKYQAAALYRKRRERETKECEEEYAEQTEPEDDTVFLKVCSRMDASVISECIHSLDEKYSDILKLYYLYEHSVKEIANMFQLKENTVRVRLIRGRDKLMKLLEGRNLNGR